MKIFKKFNISKLGLTFVALYLVFIVSFFFYVNNMECDSLACGLMIIFPFLPWVVLFNYLWETLSSVSHLFVIFGIIFSFVLNIFILYWIGSQIGLIASKIGSMKKQNKS